MTNKIPDQEPTTKVKEALSEAKTILEDNMYTKPNNMSLVNPNIQETPVSSIVEQASKSIWKPISELPEDDEYILVKGGFYVGNKNYKCTEIKEQLTKDK